MASLLLRGNYTIKGDDIPQSLELALGVIGLIGNLVVCVTILGAKFLHNKTNYLIFSLALADLIVCLQAITLNTYITVHIPQRDADFIDNSYPRNRIAGEQYCRFVINKYMYWANTVASVYFLVAVSFERYLAIVRPFQYLRFFTTRRLVWMIAIIWIWSFFEESYLAVFTKYDAHVTSCKYDFTHNFLQTLVPIWGFTLSFLVPLSALVFMYLRIIMIIITLKRSSKKHLTGSRHAPALQLTSAKRKVVKILLVVFAAFVIFWTPAQVTFFLYHFGISFKESGDVIKSILYLLPWPIRL
ncbi:melatonin receptor type 1B-B-like [Amphiura filiformis]|uniref:melatonin receptor type 1B-B-like n=1 Tax=Amphiura filiformis TaxID=82378 RepID=UPI003B2259D3